MNLPYGNDHCSKWSGIPQDILSDANRKHIEILVHAFNSGPWNLPLNWSKAHFSDRRTIVKLYNGIGSTASVRLFKRCEICSVGFAIEPSSNTTVKLYLYEIEQAGNAKT